MKFIDEYRDGQVAQGIAKKIAELARDQPMTFMEVCGTHTMAIHRHGIQQMLSSNIQLISGPGCPVCVTPNFYLDRAIAYSRTENVILCTFGDMMRVPGSTSSLDRERALGRDIRIVYSPLDAVEIATCHPEKEVIFLGVGFETTAPTVAAAILTASHQGVTNFLVSCAHKTMPNVMAALVGDGDIQLDGFICPAHVSTIIGSKPYEFLAKEFGKACVVTGFEPVDILQGLLMLVDQISSQKIRVEIQYRRVATVSGNQKALSMMRQVFEPCDDEWRGIGTVKGSGLRIRADYGAFDADRVIKANVERTIEPKGCLCGQILRGKNSPPECKLFGIVCTPQNPVGACMVSSEGTCAAFYKYSRKEGLMDEVVVSNS